MEAFQCIEKFLSSECGLAGEISRSTTRINNMRERKVQSRLYTNGSRESTFYQ